VRSERSELSRRKPILWGLAIGAAQVASPIGLRWLDPATVYALVLAATAVTATAWILVAGYTGNGIKDYWQERRQYVANTRWWPPFCAAVDWLVAAFLVVEIAAGVNFH
jgi:hypothetical protein